MNNSLDYDAMLANSTAKNQFIKIEPGESILQLFDVIDGRLVPSHVNHTLHGTLDSLEPHAVTVGTPPGRYELRTRIENAVNAIQSFGYFFNVTAAPYVASPWAPPAPRQARRPQSPFSPATPAWRGGSTSPTTQHFLKL